MSFRIVGFTVGILLCILGIAQIIPALIDVHVNERNANAFFSCAVVCMFFGGILMLANQNYRRKVTIREAFMLTNVAWLTLSIFGAFPLMFADTNLSFADAFFESVSGITTTGSTVLVGLDDLSHGVLLWRSIMQWIGGIGVIAFAIVLLPFLRVGGMQLFRTESSDQSEKIVPKSAQIVLALVLIYCFLTITCAILYALFGMSLFDAINHAMTTVPTGGYSTYDASFGHFESPYLQLTAIVYMILGGLPFVLYAALVFKGRFNFFNDEQFRWIMGMYAGFISILSLWLWLHSDYSLAESAILVGFNVVSVITTTGFATADYTLWGPFVVIMFFFLTYLGACAGSTSGGIKTVRIIVVARSVGVYIRQLLYPNGVFVLKYQGAPMKPEVVMNIFVFFGFYVLANAFLTLALALTGLDFITAISGAATALANVGPGLGDTIGPAGNFSSLSDTAKYLLSLGMLLGRLELLTVVVLLTPDFWRG